MNFTLYVIYKTKFDAKFYAQSGALVKVLKKGRKIKGFYTKKENFVTNKK